MRADKLGSGAHLKTEALEQLDLHLWAADSDGADGVGTDGINHVLELLCVKWTNTNMLSSSERGSAGVAGVH